jgi:redox-sensitive bicupin YhaK (pirin superfamily)
MTDTDIATRVERRAFDSLGHADHGWLNARHHFSFADYYDPKRMSWGSIRVWNDDEIGPNSGFPPHPHRDMEIITYVRKGAITHQDSMGNVGRTAAGDVQVMGATVKAGESVSHTVGEGRHAYLVPATGAVEILGERYEARDGIAISGGQTVEIKALDDAELVLVDAD